MELQIYRRNAINNIVKNEYVFNAFKNQKFCLVFQNADFVDYPQIQFLLKEFCGMSQNHSDNNAFYSLRFFNYKVINLFVSKTEIPSVFINNGYVVSFTSLLVLLHFLFYVKKSFMSDFIYPSLLGDYIARRYTSVFSGVSLYNNFFPDFTSLSFFNLVEAPAEADLFFRFYFDLFRTCDILIMFYVNI